MVGTEEKPRAQGVVIKVLPDTKYIVQIKLGGMEHQLVAYPSGKIRKNYIKIEEKNQVIVELDTTNLDLGRIIFRIDPGRAIPEYAKPTLTDELLN